MATNTPKVGLRKPAGTDPVSVVFDVGDNMDKIDARLGDKKMYRRTAGNVPVTTSYAPIPGADLVLKAVVGDWIEAGVNAVWNTEPVVGYMDIWSRLNGASVNSWAGNNAAAPIAGHQGASGWYGVSSVLTPVGGSLLKQVVAGDLDAAGFLTLAPFAYSSAGTKTLYAVPTVPFQFYVINHGNP